MSKDRHQPHREEQQRVILDSINEAVFTVDRQWRITSFNRGAEALTGVPRNEAIGQQCSDVFHTDICEHRCVLRRTLASGKPLVGETAQIIGADGSALPVRLSTAVLRDEGGQIVGGVETLQDLSSIEELRKELEERYTFEDIVGRSPAMRELFSLLPTVAESSSTVLITGESGTGKELVARAIHNLSPRKNAPFVAVNCAALPDTLLESELFGYVKGAFTDARRDKLGRFQRADGGTLFLDEIGDISPAMQVRLLRALQEREVEPLGGAAPVPVDVRVIAATHQDLKELLASGQFREDLYYRIRVIELPLPPLRERREDIPLLAEHLLRRIAGRQGREPVGMATSVLAKLMNYPMPGNVRELENILEQAFVLSRGGRIQLRHLPRELRGEGGESPAELSGMTLEQMERLLIRKTLENNDGHRGRTARELGIDPSTLYRKLKALGLEGGGRDGRGTREG